MSTDGAAGAMRPLVLSEYEQAFRRPSQSSQRSQSDVAGVNSHKMTQLNDVHKRAHLNRRAMWQPNSSPATTPRQRNSTPPRTTTPTRSTTPPRTRTPPKETASPRNSNDAVEELCRRWEAWAQDISNAVEKGASLPPPPVPKPHDRGVTSTMCRLLEASAFAAAALARGNMDAKKLTADVKNLDDKLADKEDEILRLQNIIDELEQSNEERSNGEAKAKIHIEELKAAGESSLSEINRLKKRGEDLEKALKTESADRKEAERRLKLPCRACEEAQRRLSDLGDEAENLRVALQDSEARRHKEVEDALQLADSAEAKYKQLMTVLRQVLASNGGDGATADVMAGLTGQITPRGGNKLMASLAAPARSSETTKVASSRATPPRGRATAPDLNTEKSRRLAPNWNPSKDKITTSVEHDNDEEEEGEEEAEAEPLDHLESCDYRDRPQSKAWPSASSQSRPSLHDSSGPHRSPLQSRGDSQSSSRQYRDAPSYDAPAGGSSVHSTRRRQDLGSSSSSKLKASDTSGQSPRRPSSSDIGRGAANSSTSSPDDLSNATQRLEQEVVELCRALGGNSSDDLPDSGERCYEDSEAKATARRRARAKA